jgi:hypothetical protein
MMSENRAKKQADIQAFFVNKKSGITAPQRVADMVCNGI